MNSYLLFLIAYIFGVIFLNVFLFISKKIALLIMKKKYPEYLRICPKCESIFFENSIFCDECGIELLLYGNSIIQDGKKTIRVVGQEENVKPTTRMCFDCGYHYTHKNTEAVILYCPYCGKKTFGFDEESFERLYKMELEDK